MNSQSLAAEFANRTSGFWSYMTREALADWVVRADAEPQPFGALPSAGPRLPGLIRAINDADAKRWPSASPASSCAPLCRPPPRPPGSTGC
jgi:hypothetical protein